MTATATRVALLNPVFWPEVRRGAERLVHDLAVGLHRAGDRPRIITSHRRLPSRRVEDDVPVLRGWRPPDGPLRRRMVQPHLVHLPMSALALAAGRDELVHAFYPTDACLAARWGARTGRPVVFTWTGLPSRAPLVTRRGALRAAVEALRGADAVVTLSEAARRELRRWLNHDSRVIAPGVDLTAFVPGGRRAEAPTVLCPSALGDARKRGDLLVAGFGALRRRRPDARLILQRPADAVAVAHLGGTPGVELRDLDDGGVLRDAYREAHVTALPAAREAFGLVVAESLACGTPAVVAPDGGSAELVTPLTGVVADLTDAEALARALEDGLTLAADAGTQSHCRERAAAFSSDRATAAHRALYRELLDAR